MKIAFITALPYGSVANQMYKIADAAIQSGHTCYTFSKEILLLPKCIGQNIKISLCFPP